ncbi:MAG TPA: hypothetical protein ENG03_12730 [Thioploca sp.]|nr:MAG: hypothetical protein DRR08_10070 [Gammaproteobacteria bacterium]HDN27932.1 hypothetical protein [Thioploca sp.]
MRTLKQVASRLIWWQPPEISIKNSKRLITQVMEYGNLEDVQAMLYDINREEIIDALDNPLPGVMTAKSWHFWHIYFGKPVPPLPKRRLPG